jgi:hypothetical protein
MMDEADCAADACATNMGIIHLRAGDLVGAYRYFLPLAESGDASAIDSLIDICRRAGDTTRAEQWLARRAAE